jgi:hypothetical protein
MLISLLGPVKESRRTCLIYKHTALIALVIGRSFKMTLTGNFIADFIFKTLIHRRERPFLIRLHDKELPIPLESSLGPAYKQLRKGKIGLRRKNKTKGNGRRLANSANLP